MTQLINRNNAKSHRAWKPVVSEHQNKWKDNSKIINQFILHCVELFCLQQNTILTTFWIWTGFGFEAVSLSDFEMKLPDWTWIEKPKSVHLYRTPLPATLLRSVHQRWSDGVFLLGDPILFLKNDIRIQSKLCFGWNHAIHIRQLSKSVLWCTTSHFCVYFASHETK